MARNTALIINISVVVLTLLYLVVAFVYYTDKRSHVKCSDVRITIGDSSSCGFVTPSIVEEWLTAAGVATRGVALNQIDVSSAEQVLASQDYIHNVNVYTTIDGSLHINLNQRHPILRIISEGGYDFYIDSSLCVMQPTEHFIAQVPMVNGIIPFSFPNNYYGIIDEKKAIYDTEFFKKLINFVQIITNDEFLQSLIVQVYVNQSQEIELIPRISNQLIEFGTLEKPQERLTKLKEFYRQSFVDGWWIDSKIINLRYDGQVIIKS